MDTDRAAHCIGDTAVGEPAVQLRQGLEPKPRGEELLAGIAATWFSTWPFSQPAAGVQAVGSTR